MQSAPADKQYFYHYHILSFLCSKIMLCKRCKQGVKQAFLTQKTAYLSHSWCYSQILPWQTNKTFVIFCISFHILIYLDKSPKTLMFVCHDDKSQAWRKWHIFAYRCIDLYILVTKIGKSFGKNKHHTNGFSDICFIPQHYPVREKYYLFTLHQLQANYFLLKFHIITQHILNHIFILLIFL